VQLYVKSLDSKLPQPLKSLKGFKRINIKKGQSTRVEFVLKADDLKYFDESKDDFQIEPGNYELQIGASSEDIRSKGRLSVTE
jgi:beta-glucosidase